MPRYDNDMRNEVAKQVEEPERLQECPAGEHVRSHRHSWSFVRERSERGGAGHALGDSFGDD